MIIIRCVITFYISLYTQPAFVFYLLVDLCIIHNHTVAFFSKPSLDRLWYLSWDFSCSLLLFWSNLNDKSLEIFVYIKNDSKKYKNLLEDIKMPQFTCVGENNEKYITFSVPIQKEVIKIDKNGEESTKIIPCRLQFIDSTRFMESSLSIIFNNLDEGIHKIKCKYQCNDKKVI